MDMTIPYLRSQADLLAEVKVLTRLGTSGRWEDTELYAALNQVLMTWADKVLIPHVYTISGGWVAGTYEYALPAYARPPYFVELKRSVPYNNYVADSLTSHWQEVPGWEVISDGAGGQVIRLFNPPRTVDGQVHYYSPNSRVPSAVPTTSGSTSSTATTMLLGSAIDVDDVGYVKCESEWMAYYGVTRGSATTTLNNLVRALFGTTAATHAGSTSCYWGVAVDTPSLWRVLYDQWRSVIAAMYLNDGGTHETERYEKMLGYYDQVALNFWAGYRPHRKTASVGLNQRAYSLRG